MEIEQIIQQCVLEHYPNAQCIEYPDHGYKVVGTDQDAQFCFTTPHAAWNYAAMWVLCKKNGKPDEAGL